MFHAFFLTAVTWGLDSTVRFVMSAHHVAGISIGYERGATARFFSYGTADGRRAVDRYTLFDIGSVTKTFTAAAVLAEIERGRLHADDRLRAYLQLPGIDASATIEEALQQTAGIPDYDAGEAPEDALREAPTFAPGTRFAYSNGNYWALGRVVERVENAPFDAVLEQLFLRPLHLPSTGAGPAIGLNAAIGFRDGTPVAPEPWTATFAAAGLHSNARDVLAWMHALAHGDGLSREHALAMRREGMTSTGEPTGYGESFFVGSWDERAVAYATGYVPGFSCVAAELPDSDSRVVILANEDRVDLVPLARSVIAFEAH